VVKRARDFLRKEELMIKQKMKRKASILKIRDSTMRNFSKTNLISKEA
jgi:hypothetical protein